MDGQLKGNLVKKGKKIDCKGREKAYTKYDSLFQWINQQSNL